MACFINLSFINRGITIIALMNYKWGAKVKVMYIKKSIENVCNYIKSDNNKEAMILLRDIEANLVRYDFEIMGNGFLQFAELYKTKKNRRKAIEMYQKAIIYFRETNNTDKIAEISKDFENLIM